MPESKADRIKACERNIATYKDILGKLKKKDLKPNDQGYNQWVKDLARAIKNIQAWETTKGAIEQEQD